MRSIFEFPFGFDVISSNETLISITIIARSQDNLRHYFALVYKAFRSRTLHFAGEARLHSDIDSKPAKAIQAGRHRLRLGNLSLHE